MYRNICFTINNPTTADRASLNLLTQLKTTRYLVYGEEVGESGTQHLQGYVEFTTSKTSKDIIHYLPRAHIESRKGTAEQASMYCKKDGKFQEFGKLSQQGVRTDINEMVESIKTGSTLFGVIHNHPNLYIKYPKAIETMVNMYKQDNNISSVKQDFEEVIFYPWQQDLLNIINEKPDSRKIHWWYDKLGNSGKSYFTTYLMVTHNAYVVTGGTKADIFYAYDYQKIIVLDLSRDCQDKTYIYDVMENFKNGQFLSTKYMTQMKIFKVPHVIVFANFCPDKSKLSEDRWDIRNIGPPEVNKVIIEEDNLY